MKKTAGLWSLDAVILSGSLRWVSFYPSDTFLSQNYREYRVEHWIGDLDKAQPPTQMCREQRKESIRAETRRDSEKWEQRHSEVKIIFKGKQENATGHGKVRQLCLFSQKLGIIRGSGKYGNENFKRYCLMGLRRWFCWWSVCLASLRTWDSPAPCKKPD